MELRFLGGASEIGSLGLVVRDDARTLLFDYGMTPSDPPTYPPLPPDAVEAAFLTHAHLDHSGMTPMLGRLPRAQLVATPVTLAVADLLTKDALKIARLEGYVSPYNAGDIRTVHQRATAVPAHGVYRNHGLEVDLLPAGHIPGATMFLYRGSQDLLFTGDVQTIETHLVKGAEPPRCDILVVESTYAGREHPDRAETERQFRARIEETIDRGGTAIVPAFAVGRAQEVLLALAASGYTTYLDGMARAVNSIYASAPEYLADSRKFKRALEAVHVVEHPGDRKRALREADVIVTTGGMLDGGPVLYYIGECYRDPRHSIFLTGYQVEGSNGRQLLTEGTLTIDETTVRPECEVRKFDFSAHASHSELLKLVRATGATTVVLMHGDQRELLKDDLESEVRVITPSNGELFTA